VKAIALAVAAGGATAVVIRLARSRHRRSLHPDGRSFTGELQVAGLEVSVGSDLIDRPGRHPITIRLSKGIGTRPGRRDIRGVAIRVHSPGNGLDLLLSSAGSGRLTAHLPAPRSSFDTRYGTITAYRTGSGRKVRLAAGPDPHREPLGRTLESVAAAAATHRAGLLMYAEHDGTSHAFGRVVFGSICSPAADAELAFDPVRRSSADLHPSGAVHGLRAFAYRLSQRWRGATPPPTNPAAVARTVEHR
jgi:NAD(P)-dependent dehydrogenase (short-subunit alcohol dehydrogenase family)